MQAMALDGEWTTCSGHPLCPATDPYMMFDGQPTAGEFTPMARCGRWCGGSSESFCATKAPEYLFTFDVTNASATSSAYVLHLASAAGERRFSLVSRASMPAAIELTDSSTGAVLALEAIGSPVK